MDLPSLVSRLLVSLKENGRSHAKCINPLSRTVLSLWGLRVTTTQGHRHVGDPLFYQWVTPLRHYRQFFFFARLEMLPVCLGCRPREDHDWPGDQCRSLGGSIQVFVKFAIILSQIYPPNVFSKLADTDLNMYVSDHLFSIHVVLGFWPYLSRRKISFGGVGDFFFNVLGHIGL